MDHRHMIMYNFLSLHDDYHSERAIHYQPPEGPRAGHSLPASRATEAYIDALWTYILGLVKAGVEELQDRPSVPGADGSQTVDYVQIPWTLR